MGFQSFRGAGQGGVVGTSYAVPYGGVLARCGELDAPAVDSVREALREVVAGREDDEQAARQSERVKSSL